MTKWSRGGNGAGTATLLAAAAVDIDDCSQLRMAAELSLRLSHPVSGAEMGDGGGAGLVRSRESQEAETDMMQMERRGEEEFG